MSATNREECGASPRDGRERKSWDVSVRGYLKGLICSGQRKNSECSGVQIEKFLNTKTGVSAAIETAFDSGIGDLDWLRSCRNTAFGTLCGGF